MNSYYELRIKINPDIEDIISDICFENLPCEGIVLFEETYKDLEMVSTTEGTLRVFLTEKADVENVLKVQRDILKQRGFTDEELGSWEFAYSEKENEDWSKKWKEKWDITYVSDKITVVPDWLEYTRRRDDEVIIRLEPGCAFGTGTHATTQLCMMAVEEYMPYGAQVADIGTGSGILAICAAKFGAKSVYGCDNDETVIDVAKENALKNGVFLLTNLQNTGSDGGCFFELNTADKLSKQFDFVLANILHNVLTDIMGDLKAIMKKGSYMVLSGILDEKKPVVLDAIKKHNLELIKEMHKNQWVALVVRK